LVLQEENFNKNYVGQNLDPAHIMYIAWRVLGWRMEGSASRYGGQLRIYWICSCRHPTRSGPPAPRLGEVLTNSHRKKACYDM